MNKYLASRLSYLAVAMTLWGGIAVWAGESVTSDRIVAIVNDDVVTESDVAAFTNKLLQQAEDRKRPVPSQDQQQLRQAVLEQLIEEQLILQEAKRRDLKASFEDVEKRLEEIRSQFAGRQDYEAMLAESHLTEEQLKTKLREQPVVQRAIDYQIRPKIRVSPAEVARASSQVAAADSPGEEVEALHLLIRVTESRPAAEAKGLAEQLHQRLLNGDDFEQLARNYSEEPHAEDGGRMGWVSRGELLPELDAVLFQLQPGQVSESIQTKLGFHLLKVMQRRTVSDRDVADAQRKVEGRIYQEKFSQALAQWLHELKERAYIHVVE